MGLIDALIAALVLALGMLAAAQFQRHLRQHADDAGLRSVAVRIAQDELERARRQPDGAMVADQVIDTVAGAAQTAYRVERRVGSVDGPMRPIGVRVQWTDRRGETQQVALAAGVAWTDPHLVGALVVAPVPGDTTGPMARAAEVPAQAQDLGDGRSLLRPSAASTESWLIDNRSATVLGRCASASLGSCDGVPGRLLAGTIRFAGGGAPDPTAADDTPADAFIAVVPTGAGFARPPVCLTDARQAGSERGLRWHCIVYPTGADWGGRITVAPAGWTIGVSAAERRVCRYSADSDGSGAVDTAHEHPADHAAVAGALLHQNFLVIRGDLPCPAAAPAILDPLPSGVFADASTVTHQP
jgi:hypothetical protein